MLQFQKSYSRLMREKMPQFVLRQIHNFVTYDGTFSATQSFARVVLLYNKIMVIRKHDYELSKTPLAQKFWQFKPITLSTLFFTLKI